MMKNKNYLLTVTGLKTILKQKSKEDLITILIECYKNNDMIKELISVKYAGNETTKRLFEGYGSKIHDAFFNERNDTFNLSKARQAIADFKKICNDEGLLVELMLYYVEMGVEFTNSYGDIDERFYSSMVSMYASVIKLLNKQDSPSTYYHLSKRLNGVVDDTENIGWGFHEALFDLYYENKWLEDEEEV